MTGQASVATVSPNVPTVIRIWGHYLSRNEPLHRLLPLRALLQRYADGTDLGVYGAHDNVYFGRRKTARWKANFPVTWSKFARRRIHRQNALRELQP